MKRVVVTGGATNIGAAITEAFLREGARVVVGQPDPAVARQLVARFAGRVVALQADVGHPASCVRFVARAARVLGGIDVLVNNAAITGDRAFSTLDSVTPAHFRRMVDVNLGGALFCTQAALAQLRRSRGVVIHLSSTNAVRPQARAMVYAATKAALESLTKSMAKELAADGIRVVAVAPGDIWTGPDSPRAPRRKGHGPVPIAQAPLGRGRPADVADLVTFLASNRARFVTGTAWILDGGAMA